MSNFLKYIGFLVFTIGCLEGKQTPWDQETVEGFTIYEDKLETTEGFGAYLDFCLKPGARNFDNGGGTHDYNSQFLKRYLGVENVVYDPYQRPTEHNDQAVKEVEKGAFDTSTSISVLNVIDSKQARLDHISLSCRALKEHGIAYFKVFPGDGSSQESKTNGTYQSNQPASSYKQEVEAIFGEGNVVVDHKHQMLIAYKNDDCK